MNNKNKTIESGEVYFYPRKAGSGGYTMQEVDVELTGDERSLLPAEVPGWRRDKVALNKAIEWIEKNTSPTVGKQYILAEIKELSDG